MPNFRLKGVIFKPQNYLMGLIQLFSELLTEQCMGTLHRIANFSALDRF